MRGAYFYGFIGAFAVGTAFGLRGYLDIGESALLLLIAVAASTLLYASLQNARTPHALCVVIIILSGLGVGALRASHLVHQDNTGRLDAAIGTRVELRATVADDPIVSARNQKVVLKVEGERDKVIAFAPHFPAFGYGDVVIASGMVKHPEPFVIDGSQRTFDYPAYLAKDGISFILDAPKITATGEQEGSVIRRPFVALRHAFVTAVTEVVPEPYAGLANGIVLGVDGALSKADEELFRRSGLIHIVVVSGYNITLVGDMIGRALSHLPPALSSLGSLIGILAFIMTTGASATAVRAGIMATLVLISRLTKRHYDMQRALVAAGFIMVMHAPHILLYDPSFQLSFLATWGLSELTPITVRLFARLPAFLRDIAGTTLATQTAVTPLLIYMSGQVSTLSLPANILVLPFVPMIMIGTLVIGALGSLPVLALLPLGSIVHGVGAYVFSIARLIDSIPMNVVAVPALSLPVLAGIYVVLFAIAWTHKKRAFRFQLLASRTPSKQKLKANS